MNILLLLVQLVFLYFNLIYWHSGFLGWILFVLYLLLVGAWWQKIFRKVFNMKEGIIIIKLLSGFAVFLLLSFGSSIFAVWHKLTPQIIFMVYTIIALLSFAAHKLSNGQQYYLFEEYNILRFKQGFSKDFFIKNYFFLIPVYIILWCAAIFFLWQNKSAGILNSPWQGIDKFYLPVFFLLTAMLGVIVFSQHKVKQVLLCIIMHSFLLHLYLPLSHVLPWGGDVWRHIAIEEKLLAGEYYPPVLAGPEAKWREVFNIDLPEALVIPNKYLYGQLWGSVVLLSQTLQIDLLAINKWLLPILWSIIFPLILFRLGKILFGSWRSGLVLAAGSAMFFPFQVLGAITLPVSLGYLTFFFVLMLWLQYLRDEVKWQKYIAIIFALLMLFGYTLHFIFIWLIILLSYFRPRLLVRRTDGPDKFHRFGVYLLAIISVLFFPLLELFSKISQWPARFDWFVGLKRFIGQFTGWYFVSGIRPHDILSGNIIFNHTPSFAFVTSLFMDWRWPVMPIMIGIWLLVGYAMFFDKKNKAQAQWVILKLFFSSVVGGYIIGWFVLEGDRSFIRRFDALLAFGILIFLVYGLSAILKKRILHIYSRIIILLLCFGFGWLATVTYASGPDMRVVSQNEYDAANYVWQRIVGSTSPLQDKKEENYCILGDTWVLLVLEGVSAQKIVGGGFPIDYQFAQSERTAFYNEIQSGENSDIFLRMRETTNSDKCFVVLPKDIVTLEKYKFMQKITGSEGVLKGDLFIWEETTTSSAPVSIKS